MSNDRVQRDLEWVLESPDLLSLSAIDCLKGIKESDKITSQKKVMDADFYKNSRLGHYFEQLWFTLVEQSSALEMIAKNMQVILAKKTIGEFDSIFKVKSTQETIHCELAVKFYLQLGSGERLSDWVGPNLKDRFDTKYLRLVSHQLALSKNPLVSNWLNQRLIVINKIKLLSRGRLFYPLQSFENQNFIYPEEVAKGHLKGFWSSIYGFSNWLTASQKTSTLECYQLPKKLWLSDISEQEIKGLQKITVSNIVPQVQQLVVWEPKQKVELRRGFIVPNEWLESAKLRIKE